MARTERLYGKDPSNYQINASMSGGASHHRRDGKGASLRIITQARLRCRSRILSNSARPTVTVRPSGKGTLPPAASTAATRSRSAIKYASTSSSIWCMRARPLSAPSTSNRLRDYSHRNVSGLDEFNAIIPVSSGRSPGLSCMSAAQQLKREPSVVACFRRANPRIMSGGTLTDRYRGVGFGLGRGRPTARTAVCGGKEFPSNSTRVVAAMSINRGSESLSGEKNLLFSHGGSSPICPGTQSASDARRGPV